MRTPPKMYKQQDLADTLSKQIETKNTITPNLNGSDEFENVEIIESTTLTETFISTTTSETTNSIIYPGTNKLY